MACAWWPPLPCYSLGRSTKDTHTLSLALARARSPSCPLALPLPSPLPLSLLISRTHLVNVELIGPDAGGLEHVGDAGLEQ